MAKSYQFSQGLKKDHSLGITVTYIPHTRVSCYTSVENLQLMYWTNLYFLIKMTEFGTTGISEAISVGNKKINIASVAYSSWITLTFSFYLEGKNDTKWNQGTRENQEL